MLFNSTCKLLCVEINKIMIALKKNKFINMLSIIIFGTLSFPITRNFCCF